MANEVRKEPAVSNLRLIKKSDILRVTLQKGEIDYFMAVASGKRDKLALVSLSDGNLWDGENVLGRSIDELLEANPKFSYVTICRDSRISIEPKKEIE